jgi:glycosyltransferase involved in cell wall biosynthesis
MGKLDDPCNIGIVSFRLAGTDGVSLETFKWVEVLERMGFPCYFMAGELETPPERSFLVEEAHFMYPEIRNTYLKCFDRRIRDPETTEVLHEYRKLLKVKIKEFVEKFDIRVLIPENSLTIPLNISLAMALTEVIEELGLPTIAHHHDFFWERKRFLTNCVWEYLNAYFPPRLPQIHHVVINTSGRNQLSYRTGAVSTLIPNVMDFDKPAPGIDDYNVDARETLGILPDELLILQPTRVVQRKGIEHAIELVSQLDRKAILVISHASGDEGYDYQQRVRKYAELLNVRTLFVDTLISNKRGTAPDGNKIYTLDDIYPHADLVTYPSLVEGFGNAFLEAVYHRTPILVNNYNIYSYDIRPKGFKVVEMDNYISDNTIAQALEVLENPDLREEMAEHNYQLGLKYYSYGVLEMHLRHILESLLSGVE